MLFFLGSTKYLSWSIQNEIIDCIGTRLEANLVEKIKNSPFFSIILDTTQDITKKDQLSIVVRISKICRLENKHPISVEVEEIFLGFFELNRHAAADLVEKVTTLFSSKSLDLKKCVGQGYDGANVMSGAYKGVQKLIKNIQPTAHYVHCAGHNLNLVLNDAVQGCLTVQNFFAVLQEIYTFFGYSIKRWDLLSKFTAESEITLKKLDPTRWSSRVNSIAAVKLRFFDIIKALSEIMLNGENKKDRDGARAIKKKIETFEFLLLCDFLYNVFNKINLASKVLQRQDIDLGEATRALEQSKENLKSMKEEFEVFKNRAIVIATKYKISPHFKVKRQIKAKKYFDELSVDRRLENGEVSYRTKVYENVLDIIISQMDLRFKGMQTVQEHFFFLNPKTLLELEETEILRRCDTFQGTHKDFIGPAFSMQYLNFLSLIKDDIKDTWTTKKLCEQIFSVLGHMECDFTEVFTSVLLFYSIPVTSATAERTFSKLKIIKNYLRNKMSQDRLKNLALIAIENRAASELDVSELIEEFSNRKARKLF